MVFTWLLVAFIVMPMVELALLFKVHGMLGTLPTVLIVILTGFVGASLARWQGMTVLWQIQRDLAEGRMPAPRMMDGIMILVAAVLLVTPGLVTDSVGFLLLVPPMRAAIRGFLRKKLEAKLRDGSVQFRTWHG